MKWIFIAMALAISLPTAFADNGLKGTWKKTNEECLSGAPFARFSKGMTGSIDAIFIYSEDRVVSTFLVKMKLEKSYANRLFQNILDTAMELKEQADGAEKESAQAALEENFVEIRKLAAGVSCKTKESASYTLEGSILHRSAPLTHVSSCAGDTRPEGSDNMPSNSVVEIKGGTAKLTDVETETQDDSACPKGDKVVTTLVKIK